MFKLARLVIAVGGALAVVVVVWFALQYFPVGGSGRQVLVTVRAGDSMSAIAGELHQAGVLSSPFAFRIDSFVEGAPQVRPGVYEFAQGADYSSIRSILTGGPNVPQVDVVPGLTLREVFSDLTSQVDVAFAAQFRRDLSVAAASSAYHPSANLEGLIGPGLYLITPGETPAQLLAAMQAGFARESLAVGFSPSSSVGGLDAYQLLIAASIVDKEGYYSENMPRVARVIFNRLDRNMPLQMDSTVLYALGRDGGRVTPQMLRTPTPYNTYLNRGLTPSPIGVVSPQALAAVLHPPVGPWLYFVLVDKSGHEAFSTTYAQQLAQEARAARAGV